MLLDFKKTGAKILFFYKTEKRIKQKKQIIRYKNFVD